MDDSVTTNTKHQNTKTPRRSMPRHPIAMTSTPKPPDPMPCALAAVLLQESRAHGCQMQKTLFPGPALHARGAYEREPVPACRVHSYSVGGRRESERRPGYREAVPGTTGGRRPLVKSCSRRGTPGGIQYGVVCERVGARQAGRRSVSQRCRVGHAWTLGLVRRPVALSGSSLRWPFGALGCCCMESWWITESILTMRTLRVVRS